jgi:hypothetical protein
VRQVHRTHGWPAAQICEIFVYALAQLGSVKRPAIRNEIRHDFGNRNIRREHLHGQLKFFGFAA